ncbi:MAG: sodium:solute symporter family protein [Verrucomicrobiales bacterium]|nr:sodium:solute symporter family protein [Verrucomicrobiales bacterium]
MTSFYILVGYLLLLVGLGLVTNRLFKGTSADYFVVGRSVGSFLLLMSVFGTTMTGFALVGSTGKAYSSGVGVYGMMASWSGLIHSAVFFAVGIRLWAVGKRHGYLTQCEYFRDRFESPALGYFLFPVLVLLVIPYLLVGVIAAGKFIQPTTAGLFPEAFPMPPLPDGRPHPLTGGIPPAIGGGVICLIVLFYVFFGGLRGAVWANAFQTIVFMATGVIAFWMISKNLGGLKAASEAVAASEFGAPRLAREGMMGQLQFFSYFFVPLSVGMFPHLFQHWLTAKSAKSFRLTVVAFPVFIMIVWLPCILIGVWAAGYLDPAQVPNANAVLGRMINDLVHSPVLTGLVGAGVLAAIMSSLDSQFMCVGTMFTNDIVVRVFGRDRFSDTQKIWIARGFILAVVGVTYVLAIWLKDSAHVFDLGVWCFSGFASLFPIVFASVYWKGVTKAGVFASLLTSVVLWSILFYRDIFATKTAAQKGEELLVAGMMPVMPLVIASAVALVVVSLLTKRPSDATLKKFFA